MSRQRKLPEHPGRGLTKSLYPAGTAEHWGDGQSTPHLIHSSIHVNQAAVFKGSHFLPQAGNTWELAAAGIVCGLWCHREHWEFLLPHWLAFSALLSAFLCLFMGCDLLLRGQQCTLPALCMLCTGWGTRQKWLHPTPGPHTAGYTRPLCKGWILAGEHRLERKFDFFSMNSTVIALAIEADTERQTKNRPWVLDSVFRWILSTASEEKVHRLLELNDHWEL